MILYDDPADIQDSYKDVMTYVANVEAIANSFEKTIIQEEVNKYFEDWKKAWAVYKEDLEILLEMCLENRDEEAFEFTRGELQDAANAVREANDKLIELKVTGARNQTESNDAAAETATVTMVAVIVVAMVLAILLGIFTSRIISNPMRKLATTADRIADGDLDVHIDIYTKEEIGQLANAFNKMVDNLNELISGINNAADQVAAGAKQVSDSSFELSKGAAEQASTIEELTASLEELSTQTRLNAENSNQANSLSEVAKENAEQGRIQMEDMIKAMEEINQSSNNISKIIKVIDDIAFQTNILALNAAVEAARAGQYGKGFAVVAEEVRNLAARSSDAAKETTDMIETSIRNVERGTAIARKTSEALNKIVDDISKVTALVGNIAVASNEQASGIEQINQGIIMVSDVVQKNSATAEESASASEELSSQADALKGQVAKFRLRKFRNGAFSYGGIKNLDAGVIRMLDNMSENKKSKTNPEDESAEIQDNKPKRIILNDNDFGKY